MRAIKFLKYCIGRPLICVTKGFPLRMIFCDVVLEEIPRSTIFGHPYGITISDGVVMGEECVLASNVTIGRRKNTIERRPIIGNGVKIGSGAIILGSVTIGDNAVIAAGAIVLTDVPADTTYISHMIYTMRPRREIP
jgi:serine O-acetyltransferase